jgi:tetratricopeptide (TPR) repeat protein
MPNLRSRARLNAAIRKSFPKRRLRRLANLPNVEQRRRFLTEAAEVIANARSIATNAVLIAILFGIAYSAYREIRTSVLIINPIHMPEALLKRGYSGEFVTARIATRLRQIEVEARTKKQHQNLAIPRTEIDVEIPGTRFSYRSAVRLGKNILGIEDVTVTGGIIQNGEMLKAQLIVHAPGEAKATQVTALSNDGDVERLIFTISEDVLKSFDPYLLAAYHSVIEDRLCLQTMKCEFERSGALYQEIARSRRTNDRLWALVGWSNDLIVTKQYEQAAEKAAEAAAINPQFASAFIAWGTALMALRRTKEATEKFDRAVELERPNAETYRSWGYALQEANQHAEAIVKYRHAAELAAGDFISFLNWCDALKEMKRYEEAISKCRRAAELNPNEPLTFNTWGAALRGLERHAEAVTQFRRATELDPKFALAFVNWAMTLDSLNRRAEAMEKAKQALAIGLQGEPLRAACRIAGMSRETDQRAALKRNDATILNCMDLAVIPRL